jgi:hypothetical protein
MFSEKIMQLHNFFTLFSTCIVFKRDATSLKSSHKKKLELQQNLANLQILGFEPSHRMEKGKNEIVASEKCSKARS